MYMIPEGVTPQKDVRDRIISILKCEEDDSHRVVLVKERFGARMRVTWVVENKSFGVRGATVTVWMAEGEVYRVDWPPAWRDNYDLSAAFEAAAKEI